MPIRLVELIKGIPGLIWLVWSLVAVIILSVLIILTGTVVQDGVLKLFRFSLFLRSRFWVLSLSFSALRVKF